MTTKIMSIYKFNNLNGTLKKAIVAVLRTCSIYCDILNIIYNHMKLKS